MPTFKSAFKTSVCNTINSTKNIICCYTFRNRIVISYNIIERYTTPSTRSIVYNLNSCISTNVLRKICNMSYKTSILLRLLMISS